MGLCACGRIHGRKCQAANSLDGNQIISILEWVHTDKIIILYQRQEIHNQRGKQVVIRLGSVGECIPDRGNNSSSSRGVIIADARLKTQVSLLLLLR